MKRALVAAGVVAACGAIDAPAFSTATSNQCADDSACHATYAATSSKLCPVSQPDCVKLKCASSACVLTPASVSVSLMVQVPSSNFRDAGMTLALSPKAIAALQKKAPASCLGSCLPIPARGGARGVLTIDATTAKTLWPGGLQGSDSSGVTAVPATLGLRPLWSDGISPRATAAWRGIALPDLEATPIEITPPQVPSGPAGAAALGYQLFFQSTPDPLDGVSAYEATLRPLPPYDAALPPVTVTLPLVSSTPTINDLLKLSFTNFPYPALDATELLPFKQLAGAPSLAGYRAYVVSLPDGARISNVVTLSGELPNGQSEAHKLYVARQTPVDHSQLVVDPPDGVVARPSIVVGNAGGALVFAQPTFPKLPPPVTVSGSVTAFDSTGQLVNVPSDLVFDAPGTVLADDPAQPLIYNLNYRVYVKTNAVGGYQVALPPGQYDVWITPHEDASVSTATPLARTQKKLSIAPFVASPQTGKSFIVSPRVHLTGRVLVGDGTPLAGSPVLAQVSADRFETSVAAAHDKTLASLALGWPRDAVATTDADGRYDLAVDPGPTGASVNMDVAVLPVESTRLPWFVSPNHAVAQADVALDDIHLPAPMPVALQLVDDLNNPVPRAVVTALLRPPSTGTTPVAARVVGRTLTDAQGRFQLFLPPSLQ